MKSDSSKVVFPKSPTQYLEDSGLFISEVKKDCIEFYDSETVFRAWREILEEEFFISEYKRITEDPEDWDNFAPIGYSGIHDKESVKILLSFMDIAFKSGEIHNNNTRV